MKNLKTFESFNVKKQEQKGFTSNIENDTLKNDNFRKVLYTSKHMQLVLMSLKPGEDIGKETHTNVDQFFRFEAGNGKCIVNENEYLVNNGDVLIVPCGSTHNIINIGKSDLKIYTIYTPPNHKDGITFGTKSEASNSKEKFDGITTE